MNTPTMEDRLRSHLISRKVAPIWADGALRNLRFSTNRYFTKSIEVKGLELHPLLPFVKDGHQIKKLVIAAVLVFPDAEQSERRAIFTYQYLRGRKAPHRVKVHHNVSKAAFTLG